MPAQLRYPGIYIEEVPSPVRTIVGVPTAVAAFVGRTRLGPVNTPVRIKSFADYERAFGGFWSKSELPYAVQQYFLNGGSDAYVVRVHKDATTATINVPTSDGTKTLDLRAKNPGAWSAGLKVSIDHETRTIGPNPGGAVAADEFNLRIELTLKNALTGADDVLVEKFRNVSISPGSASFVTTVLANESRLVEVVPPATASDFPTKTPTDATVASPRTPAASPAPSDGKAVTATELAPTGGASTKAGIYALEDAEIFTMLVIPPNSPRESDAPVDVPSSVLTAAIKYCQDRRAILLVDPLETWKTKTALDTPAEKTKLDNVRDKNTATYFPRILFADPLLEGRPRAFAPSGAMAGIMARTDQNRGVWKAPAGEEARILGALGLEYPLTDGENGDLNPLGINCLRTFPIVGSVVWGARTLAGADSQASEWKYLPVRRVALFIEETLYRSTRWILFEPNDEPLWSQIRLNIGTFLQSLFRQGAFQGASPKEAFFVKCDSQTTTQDDVNKGIVNIHVGFAPLKPVEFVVLKISQMAGRSIE